MYGIADRGPRTPVTQVLAVHAITELRRQTPKAQQANPQLDAIPEPYVMTEVEDKIIQAILDLLNANNLTAQQAKALVGRLNQLLDVGELLARRTAH
jgi:hypothetical protein